MLYLSLPHQILHAVQFVLDVLQGGDLGLGLLEVEASGVVGVKLIYGDLSGVAVLEILVVVEVTVVGRDAVEVAHVFSLGALLLGEEGLVHLLTVADADDPDVLLPAAEEFTHGLRLRAYGAGRGLLDEDVTVLPVLEREQHQVHGLLEAHDEPRHLRLCKRYRQAVADLVDPQGYHTAARAHDIAVTGAADFRAATVAALRHRHLLLDRLGDAHRVDRVRRLVGGQASPVLTGRREHVVRAYQIGLNRLHREELAARHLLQRRGVEDVIHSRHRAAAALQTADVSDVELYFVRVLRHTCLVLVAHVVLLLLVSGEDADLRYVCLEEAVEDSIAETARPAGNHKGLTRENAHRMYVFVISV